MRRTLTVLLAAAALSSPLASACQEPFPTMVSASAPADRDARIERRARIGIAAAQAYVFDDCVPIDGMRDAFATYGANYGLSARDVAEGVLWGAYHERYELPSSDEESLFGYLNEQLDAHGERILETIHILFSRGAYDQMIRPLHMYALRAVTNEETVDELRSNVHGGIRLANAFVDLEGKYAEVRDSWD